MPLELDGRVLGALVVLATEPAAFDAAEMDILIELAKDLSFGIHMLRDRAAHRALEARYASVLGSMTEGAQVIDFAWRYLYLNEVAATQGHRPRAELLGRTMMDAYPGIEGTQMFGVLRQCMESRAPQRFENKFQYDDGSCGHFELSVTPVPEGIFILSHDITATRRAEESLRESQALLAAFFDSPGALRGVFERDGDSLIPVLVNAAATRFADNADDVASQRSRPIIDPERAASLLAAAGRCALSGMPVTFETHLPSHGGDIWHQTTLCGLGDSRDGRARFAYASVDISEKKRAEEELARHRDHLEELVRERTKELDAALVESERSERALRDGEARARAVVDTAVDGIITIDERGVVETFNRAAEQIFGYSAHEVVGRNVKMLMPAPYADAHDQYLRNYLSTGERKIIDAGREVVGLRKDGTTFPLDLAVADVRLTSGGRMFTGIVRDITERRAAETVIRHARQAAEAANRAKSAFLANMSHEIRTPMNAILGFAQLLQRDGTLTEPQQRHVATIMRSGDHLLALISDLLEYSKSEAGRLALDELSFDLHGLFDDLEVTFRMRAEAKGLRLLVEHSSGTPQYVLTDPTKLRQVLQNLIANAVKFTEHGGVAMRAAVLPGPDEAAVERLVVEVEDSGPGIAPEEMGRLFQVFEQTESGRRARSGTGLGLAISRSYAELLGGTLEVASQLGHGSTFRLEIPIRRGSADAIRNGSTPRRVIALAPGQPAFRVLVADDKEDNRAFLEALLVSIGFEVRAVEDGARAVAELESWRPQLILMDMRMPVMSGSEAIERIRARSGGATVKIIAVTASAFQEDRQQAIEAGADDFISKPFREAVLFEKVHALLDVRYLFAEEERPAPPAGPAPPPSALRAEAATLPRDVVIELRHATLSADVERMLELSVHIEVHSLELAQEIRRRAAAFDYTSVLALLEEGRTT